MANTRQKNTNYLKLLVFVSFPFLLSTCGGDSQFTKKLVASPFYAELYGSATKTIALTADEGSHIAWMGLEWVEDYKYFQIAQVSINGEAITPESASSQAILEDISVSSSESASSGTIADSTSGKMLISLTYSPSVAIDKEDDPHKAYLLIVYDEPKMGTVRVELDGYTRGIAENKCAGVTSADQVSYTFKEGTFDFYLCADSDFVVENDPAGRDHVNYASVPVEGNFIFYQPDSETLCILGAADGVDSSIPDFDVDVPDEVESPIDPIEVKLAEDSLGACTLSDGQITCDGTIEVDVAGIATVDLSMTTGSVTPESDACNTFGSVSGSGSFGEGDLTLIVYGDLGSNTLLEPFGIEFAVVVAEINLEPAE